MVNMEIEDNLSLEKLIREVDYKGLENGYVPSQFAIKFINFIKLVNGAEGEENKSPVFHFELLDNINKYHNNLIVAARGTAKTTIIEYLFLYLGVFGHLDGFGEISVAMYVGDTADNGCKNMRSNLEHRYRNSEFLQRFIPTVRFTDMEIELTNADGHQLCIRMFGANTGVRGFKKYGQRPKLACHKKGTIITTDMGTHLVEDYPIVLPSKKETGKIVKVYGLLDEEVVTNDHRYKCIEHLRTKHKKYNKVSNCVYTTESTITYSISNPMWVEAKDLVWKKLLGNQKYLSHYVIKPIDYTVGTVMPIEQTFSRIDEINDKGHIVKSSKYTKEEVYSPMLYNEFWWLYGLWLADGSRSKNKIYFTVANTQPEIGEKIHSYITKIGLHVSKHVSQRPGCFQLEICSKPISDWLKKYKRGNSIKDMPDWILHLDTEKQKQILLGYIAGDGYKDYKNNQIRINSVNLTVIKQLGVIAERLGLSYFIRNTKKEGIETFPADYVCNVKHQYEIRLRDNVKKVLGFEIEDNPREVKEVFIENGYIYRGIKSVTDSELEEFIPITTPTHEYLTSFGISHNCLDDLMTDKSAESKTITKDIENVIYKAVRQAMHPTKRKVVWIGTPFTKADPLYKAAGTKEWHTKVYPICEKYPCSKKEFVGAWEDRFPYEAVKTEYDMLRANGRVDAFNQELMLRILSDDDRLVLDEDIVWYKRSDILSNINNYYMYITTDFATSEKESSDFSVIAVWALDYNGRFHWIDGITARQDMAKNVDDVFRFVKLYNPLSVGVEISGQQKGFVSWLKRDMLSRNTWFRLASDKGSCEEGLRPTTNKLVRFNSALPLFKQRKIAFPEELKDSGIILEYLDELTSITPSGIKSLHDDCIDSISQLQLITYVNPGDPIYNKNNSDDPFPLSKSKYFSIDDDEVEDRNSYIV